MYQLIICSDAQNTKRENSIVDMKFENIKNLRKANKKNQQELADYLNIKQTTYSKYELGKINIPIGVFLKLADYYNVSVDYLLGRDNQHC